MNLCNEIKSFFGDLSQQSCIHIFGKNGAYFEGVKSILAFDDGNVKLQVKQATVNICGEALSIAKYACGDVAVHGKIRLVEML